MGDKFVIKILPGEGCNPEYAPDKEMQNGVECGGFLLLTFDEKYRLDFSAMQGISRKHLKDAIKHHALEGIIPLIRQAAVVAEGEIKSLEIEIQKERNNMFKPLMETLMNDYKGDGFPDEEEQDFPEEVPQEFPEDE